MKTALDLQNVMRSRFPEISQKADLLHIERWDSQDPIYAFSWFESLADSLNSEMVAGVPYAAYRQLFQFLSDAFPQGTDEVRGCIDVAFTENLFWRVEPSKTEPYWSPLPQALKDLYVAFHQRAPL